jgi:LacI family transcriptional regulator
MSKKITLKEIAKKCGVSSATVSFVINNKNRKGISSVTWNKIEKVLSKFGYKKSKSNRSVKRIIFCFESSSHLATTRFLQGIDNDILEKNEFIFLFNAIKDNFNNLERMYNKYHPDGIIIATGRTRELEFNLSQFTLCNTVLLNCWTNDFKGISILPSDYHSTKKIIKKLIDLNKKDIAIILPQEFIWQNYADRMSGWRDAHFEKGLTINQSLICRPNTHKKYVSESEIGYDEVKKLINKKVKFDTIFAMNDMLAMGCYQAANEKKLDIPQDFSIIGFDNSITALNLRPSLSSIQLPIAEMTAKSIQHIFDTKNYDENYKVYVNCNLVERNSIE